MKRIAVLEDMSGFGRCALTIALPVLSAMGAQACPLPTAVLSAHTGYPAVVARDLSDFLAASAAHWRALGLRFDCLLTGYLANTSQARVALDFAQSSADLVVVDPAMGDGGRLYRSVPADMPAHMRDLCRAADWITPNPTEAALLLERPYTETADEAGEMLAGLLALGPRRVLIKGLLHSDGARLNVLGEAGKAPRRFPYTPLPGSFHGTGDLFASVLAGALARGDGDEAAIALAMRFVSRAIAETIKARTDPREGVRFEPLLRELMG